MFTLKKLSFSINDKELKDDVIKYLESIPENHFSLSMCEIKSKIESVCENDVSYTELLTKVNALIAKYEKNNPFSVKNNEISK